MKRAPEPELMLDAAQVRAYANADFDTPHSHFMELLCARIGDLPQTGRALDLGCGPGDISRRFAAAFPGWQVDAVDGSEAMLVAAREMTLDGSRITYIDRHLPSPSIGHYDVIFCNSLLHHLTDPTVLWATIRDASKNPCQVFVMDLLRPSDRAAADQLVKKYATGEPEVLKNDFLYSLLAAYEADEITMQLRQANLPLCVETVSDRHFIAWGNVT